MLFIFIYCKERVVIFLYCDNIVIFIKTKTKNTNNHIFRLLVFNFVVSPRLELGQAEPKTAVLPLHHETIVELYFSKAVQRYDCFSFWQNVL
jgi:hypothetical protein